MWVWLWLFLFIKIFWSLFLLFFEWILWRCVRYKLDFVMFWVVVIFIIFVVINGCNDLMFLFFFWLYVNWFFIVFGENVKFWRCLFVIFLCFMSYFSDFIFLSVLCVLWVVVSRLLIRFFCLYEFCLGKIFFNNGRLLIKLIMIL